MGTARTGAYVSVAPFFRHRARDSPPSESVDAVLIGDGALIGFGVWLHVTERHRHIHRPATIVHAYQHEVDEHHLQAFHPALRASSSHTHKHTLLPVTHRHTYLPDAHHRHDHWVPRGDSPNATRTRCVVTRRLTAASR
jgi:hypothetical protein